MSRELLEAILEIGMLVQIAIGMIVTAQTVIKSGGKINEKTV